jgi:hypothetical protein
MEETKVTPEINAEDQAWSDKLVPVAKKLFLAIAANIENAPMSTVSQGNFDEWSKDIVKFGLEQMLEADMRMRDDILLLQLMIQPVSEVVNRMKGSLDMHYDTAISKTFGAENQHSVTVKQVHEVLMGNVPSPLQAEKTPE